MLSIFKRKTKRGPRVGHVIIVEETMPLFAGTPAITNKTHAVIIEDNEGDIVKGILNYKVERNVLYIKERVLTQDGIPIVVKDIDFKEIVQDKSFIKDGFKKGQIYSFSGMGYLGNISSDEKIISVTDNFVLFRTIEENSLFFYSYRELNKLKESKKLKQLNRVEH